MKKIYMLFCTLILSFVSCTTDNDYQSISGVWLVEEYGSLTPYRRYNLSIRKYEAFDNVYSISNLYRSGDNNDTYIDVDSFTINIRNQTVGSYSIMGSGIIQPDFKKIDLQYNVVKSESGFEDQLHATFTRK